MKFRQALYLLYTLLLINSCHCGKRTYKGNEVILLIGEIGAGKSTLCNSIFQQNVFESGVNIPVSVTSHKQEHIYKDALYIDTPGIDFFSSKSRERTAKEIEQVLKYNNNYKIVFVASFNNNPSENKQVIRMIDKICNAIQTNFEYGIIINQVPEAFIQLMDKHGVDQEKVHESAYFPAKPLKAPALTVVLKEDPTLRHASNKYFQENDDNRKKLLDFLNKLNAYQIAPNAVGKIDIAKLS